ncbi:hypothetical protein BJ986_002264 [Phycicoccus badiiscoriae]|uniref:Uncharacterized protein n=1 Tax=Pedococcus badiiscoriae TaxID=642776 RepID=A0A852WEX0_9MICO|nr:hypothetical protein [Pedococcus badiiscoriae]
MTLTNTRHLRVVPIPQSEPHTAGCTVASQATLSGPQTISVRVLTPVSGSAGALIGVRVGAILILVADWEALRSIRECVAQAAELAPVAFGSEA